ncbi:hypothetical protein [Streptomyces sp. SID3212]|uniref:hypothetical protein n=1 Tax=Streptomyces sp. SID3212 TaxID=2690259 RepID=UPI001371664D|nr:hypothetical protein [Streptomyces sp. SID3212]MYV58041.1 hypothetical protein [Streptomyces sp. SID3212]
MSPRKALPPSPESYRQRAENRANRRRAVPGDKPARGISEVTKTYKVVGRRRVAGHAPGETFQLTMTQGEIDALIEAGHIEEIEPSAPEKAKPVSGTATVKKESGNG